MGGHTYHAISAVLLEIVCVRDLGVAASARKFVVITTAHDDRSGIVRVLHLDFRRICPLTLLLLGRIVCGRLAKVALAPRRT